MDLMSEEETSEQFLEKLADDVIKRLSAKFDELNLSLKDIDLSIDFLSALMADVDPASVGGLQRTRHKLQRPDVGIKGSD